MHARFVPYFCVAGAKDCGMPDEVHRDILDQAAELVAGNLFQIPRARNAFAGK